MIKIVFFYGQWFVVFDNIQFKADSFDDAKEQAENIAINNNLECSYNLFYYHN